MKSLSVIWILGAMGGSYPSPDESDIAADDDGDDATDDNDDAIVASAFITGEADQVPRPWRQVFLRGPVYRGPLPHPDVSATKRLLEWLELASGGRKVLVRQQSRSSGGLSSVASNESDISLFYHHVTAGEASRVDHLWKVGDNDIVLMTLREHLLAEEDVFLHQLKLLAGTCLLLLLVTLVLAGTLFLARGPAGALKSVAMWYVEILSQQGDHDVWSETAAGQASRLVMVGGLLVSLVCLNLFTARLASDIALREMNVLTLRSMNDLRYKWNGNFLK